VRRPDRPVPDLPARPLRRHVVRGDARGLRARGIGGRLVTGQHERVHEHDIGCSFGSPTCPAFSEPPPPPEPISEAVQRALLAVGILVAAALFLLGVYVGAHS
jgi:hypothetical protein